MPLETNLDSANAATDVRIPILLYHSITDTATDRYRRYNLDPVAFRSQLDRIDTEGRTPIAFSRLVAAIRTADPSKLPAKPIVITFDDGFVDFHDTVLPELVRREVPAILFVVAGCIGGESHWLRSLDEGGRRLMTAAMIRNAAELGVEIGAHGMTHAPLDELRRSEARREIVDSKQILEGIIGRPVTSFAYPHGYHDRWVTEAVMSAGYESATGVKGAFSHLRDDRYALARLLVRGDAPTSVVDSWMRGQGAALGTNRERPITTAWRQARRTRAALGRMVAVRK